MLFRKKASGRHRAPTGKQLKRQREEQPVSRLAPTEPEPEPVIQGEGEASVELPEQELLNLVEDEAPEIPDDAMAKTAYELLRKAGTEEEKFDSAVALLKQRSEMLDRLAGMDKRIDRLLKDSHVNELALDEIKLDAHLKDLATDEDDEDRLVRESWDMDPSYSTHRDALDRAVQLLVRMERSRTDLVKTYLPLMERLKSSLPPDCSPELRRAMEELLSDDMASFKENHAGALSEVEYLDKSDVSLEGLQEFLKELDGHGEIVEAKPGDSLFHLE